MYFTKHSLNLDSSSTSSKAELGLFLLSYSPSRKSSGDRQTKPGEYFEDFEEPPSHQ